MLHLSVVGCQGLNLTLNWKAHTSNRTESTAACSLPSPPPPCFLLCEVKVLTSSLTALSRSWTWKEMFLHKNGSETQRKERKMWWLGPPEAWPWSLRCLWRHPGETPDYKLFSHAAREGELTLCCFQIHQRQTNNVWPAGIMRLEHLCPIDLNVKSANGWRNLLF